MKTKLLVALGLAVVLAFGIVAISSAVSGAAFTTFNAAADGSGKDICKNTAINCNIYGAKEYVWLNGGPTANGLGPDGQYFFAVLVPGGQPNPNDGAVGVLNDGDKNLSDDYDAYTNRTFTVTNGEVSAYSGTHDFDSGTPGNPKVDGQPPYIRLFPYADTTNPGGVYIMAICSLNEGYPVDPRDCKYDAFKVQKGKLPYQFMLSGIKFQDTYADGVKDSTAVDPGLSGWTITIKGTGPDGNPIDATATTGVGGYWEWLSPEYMFSGGTQPGPVHLVICETLKSGWSQSYPSSKCYTLDFTPDAGSFDTFENLDFGNWQPVSVTACKVRDADGDLNTTGDQTYVAGWPVSLTEEGVVTKEAVTGADGCYTWTGLTPHAGVYYDVHEGSWTGWVALGDKDYVFPTDSAASGSSLSHDFFNTYYEGCTPGFWQGGPDKPDAKAGGALLWDGDDTMPWGDQADPPPHVDQQWIDSGGANPPGNPYIHITLFNDFFTSYTGLDGFNMFDLVGTGGGPNDYQKAARDLVAAYLNASWGMNYPYTTSQLYTMWANAVNSGDFLSLHNTLDAANNSQVDTNGDGVTEHLCPISAGGY